MDLHQTIRTGGLGPTRKYPNAEPIPGYRLLRPLGQGGFGEVWECEAPGGIHKAIKFIAHQVDALDDATGPAEQELRALQRVKDIRHPFLISLDRVEQSVGELIVVMELADKSLHDLMGEFQQSGLPGIPREELLPYLCEAAEALDVMNQQHGLQHLDIKPRNLFLVGNHVKVADFGLVSRMRRTDAAPSNGPHLGGVTPLYASPELFAGSVSPSCDQYSLAIVYQELLTGSLPFQGKTSNQLALKHAHEEPELTGVPEADQPILSRALAKDPTERFESCLNFVEALIAGRIADSAVAPRQSRLTSSKLIRRLPLRSETKGGPPEAAQSTTWRETRQCAVELAPCDVLDGATAFLQETNRSDEMVPGYRFLRCINRNFMGEVWSVQGPDNSKLQMKIIYGFAGQDQQREWKSFLKLKSLRHSGLVPMQIIQHEPGRLVILSNEPEQTLADRCADYQGKGMNGIPRDELLEYLREAATTLDELEEHHSLHHLALNPKTLVIDNGEVLLEDFGLVQLLWTPADQPIARLNWRYAAPEVLADRPSRASDQYSLALVFVEMLTGHPPFKAQTIRQMTSARTSGQPDLTLVPAAEREVLQRALQREPSQRFVNCMAFVRALETVAAERGPIIETPGILLPNAKIVQTHTVMPPIASLSSLHDTLKGLIHTVAGPRQMRDYGPLRCIVDPGQEIQHHCTAMLPHGMVHYKLESFRQHWKAEVAEVGECVFVFHVRVPGGFFRRVIGQNPCLEVRIELTPPESKTAALTDVDIRIRPIDCGQKLGGKTLEQFGPVLLEGVRSSLQASPDRRSEARLIYTDALQVRPVYLNRQVGDALPAHAKDISMNGMGLYLPAAPPSQNLCIPLVTPIDSKVISALARIVRVQNRSDGWIEVGTKFLLDSALHG